MHRDHFSKNHTAILCEQSAALRDTLFDLRALSTELKIEARATQVRAQHIRDDSRRLVGSVRERVAALCK